MFLHLLVVMEVVRNKSPVFPEDVTFDAIVETQSSSSWKPIHSQQILRTRNSIKKREGWTKLKSWLLERKVQCHRMVNNFGPGQKKHNWTNNFPLFSVNFYMSGLRLGSSQRNQTFWKKSLRSKGIVDRRKCKPQSQVLSSALFHHCMKNLKHSAMFPFRLVSWLPVNILFPTNGFVLWLFSENWMHMDFYWIWKGLGPTALTSKIQICVPLWKVLVHSSKWSLSTELLVLPLSQNKLKTWIPLTWGRHKASSQILRFFFPIKLSKPQSPGHLSPPPLLQHILPSPRGFQCWVHTLWNQSALPTSRMWAAEQRRDTHYVTTKG